MDAAARRRTEIDAKKAKLAELRRLREERQNAATAVSVNAGEVNVATLSASRDGRKDIDELVDSLIGDGLRSSRIDRSASDSAKIGAIDKVEDPTGPSTAIKEPLQPTVGSETIPVRASDDLKTSNDIPKGFQPNLVIAESTVPAPLGRIKEIVTYSKATQTQLLDDTEVANSEDDPEEFESEEILLARLRLEVENELQSEREAIEKSRAEAATALAELQELQGREIQKAAANETITARPDYTGDSEADAPTNREDCLIQTCQFYDDNTKHRMITNLSWSPKFPELVLASYSRDTRITNKMHGLVLIWNTKDTSRAEFTLECQGEVHHAIFSPFHANIIFGGTYSGQILIWDIKMKMSPILTTPLSGKGHTFPITGLHVTGTKQSHSIVSTSSDGTVCIWSPDLLAQPQDRFELVLQPPSKVEEVTPTAVSHSPADMTGFLVGSEDGNLYHVNRQDRAGAKAGIDPKIVYKGHATMITGIDHHRCKGVLDFSDLVLSCSLDWTIRLWRIKAQASLAAMVNSTSNSITESPLWEFPLSDMVYDVRWSPARPGVFACVDGSGECQIFDLTKNTEIPVAKAMPETDDAKHSIYGGRPSLNKVLWDHEGRRIVVGGADGRVTVFDVPASVDGKEGVTNEQWYRLSKKLKGVTAIPNQ